MPDNISSDLLVENPHTILNLGYKESTTRPALLSLSEFQFSEFKAIRAWAHQNNTAVSWVYKEESFLSWVAGAHKVVAYNHNLTSLDLSLLDYQLSIIEPKTILDIYEHPFFAKQTTTLWYPAAAAHQAVLAWKWLLYTEDYPWAIHQAQRCLHQSEWFTKICLKSGQVE